MGSKFIVLGAGVVGMATAYALARRGAGVTIIDAASEPGRGTSFANGAQLSYAYTDALASPATFAKLPSLISGADPAFRLHLSFDPDFVKWGLRFLANCTPTRFEHNTLTGLRLGLESREAMHRLLSRHPLDFAHTVAGKLHIYEDEHAFVRARALMMVKRVGGARQEALTPADAFKVEPALAGLDRHIVGAIYSPEEEVGDPYCFCSALRETLCANYGTTVRMGLRVARLDLRSTRPAAISAEGERIESDGIVVCAGVQTPQLLGRTRPSVPIWPMKGYSLTAPLGAASPDVSITDVARKIVFCRLGDQIRFAGLADLGQRDLRVDDSRVTSLLTTARQALPEAADYDNAHSSWAGLRPMTPSSLPIIRKIGAKTVINAGHGGLGWTYAMGSGERAATLMLQPV